MKIDSEYTTRDRTVPLVRTSPVPWFERPGSVWVLAGLLIAVLLAANAYVWFL